MLVVYSTHKNPTWSNSGGRSLPSLISRFMETNCSTVGCNDDDSVIVLGQSSIRKTLPCF